MNVTFPGLPNDPNHCVEYAFINDLPVMFERCAENSSARWVFPQEWVRSDESDEKMGTNEHGSTATRQPLLLFDEGGIVTSSKSLHDAEVQRIDADFISSCGEISASDVSRSIRETKNQIRQLKKARKECKAKMKGRTADQLVKYFSKCFEKDGDSSKSTGVEERLAEINHSTKRLEEKLAALRNHLNAFDTEGMRTTTSYLAPFTFSPASEVSKRKATHFLCNANQCGVLLLPDPHVDHSSYGGVQVEKGHCYRIMKFVGEHLCPAGSIGWDLAYPQLTITHPSSITSNSLVNKVDTTEDIVCSSSSSHFATSKNEELNGADNWYATEAGQALTVALYLREHPDKTMEDFQNLQKDVDEDFSPLNNGAAASPPSSPLLMRPKLDHAFEEGHEELSQRCWRELFEKNQKLS